MLVRSNLIFILNLGMVAILAASCESSADIVYLTPCLVDADCSDRYCRHNECVDEWEYAVCFTDADCAKDATDRDGSPVYLTCKNSECVRIGTLPNDEGNENTGRVAVTGGNYRFVVDNTRSGSAPYYYILDIDGKLDLADSKNEIWCSGNLNVKDYVIFTRKIDEANLLSYSSEIAPDKDKDCENSVWIEYALRVFDTHSQQWIEDEIKWCNIDWKDSEDLIEIHEDMKKLGEWLIDKYECE